MYNQLFAFYEQPYRIAISQLEKRNLLNNINLSINMISSYLDFDVTLLQTVFKYSYQ